MVEERDFTARRTFPGTEGNGFDIILRGADWIQAIPPVIFGLILVAMAWLPARGQWPIAAAYACFFLTDWALLEALPRFNRSFGPAHPPALALASMRALVGMLPPAVSLPAQVVGTLLVIYGFWVEPHRIRLTRQSLTTSKLPPGPPLRILHLGDLHVERITGRERQLNRMIRELRPDLILFSGDFVNLSYLDDDRALRETRELISEWQAPLGVLAVTGSPAVDLEPLAERLLHGQGSIRRLNGEKVTVEHNGAPVDIVGLSCTHKPFIDGPRLEAIQTGDTGRFSILLYHSPDLAPAAARAGFDLQLSGHTHGGQVRLPLFGAFFTGSLYGKTFEAGRINLGKLALYITRGIGMEGAGAPRVRFLCPPEVILWEISGAVQS